MQIVEGMVVDIGWYRTTIRSYEREVFVIPNAVFSKNIVLNISRKNREWRFFEMICVRVQDVHKVGGLGGCRLVLLAGVRGWGSWLGW